jgi:hypothetical protein
LFFPISDWFAAFAVTLAVETPLVVGLLRRVEPDLFRLVVLVLFANLATHLVVWYVITQLFLPGTLEYAIVAEGWAIAAEALFYSATVRGLSARRAIVVAVGANLASFLVGRLIGTAWPGLLG